MTKPPDPPPGWPWPIVEDAVFDEWWPPLTDEEIRERGYEPTQWGWVPTPKEKRREDGEAAG